MGPETFDEERQGGALRSLGSRGLRGFGFGVSGLGFRVWLKAEEFSVWWLKGFRISGLREFRVWGLKVSGVTEHLPRICEDDYEIQQEML